MIDKTEQDLEARMNMIEGQLRPNRVFDNKILDAIKDTDRSLFLPPRLKHIAYADDDIELADDRYLLAPMTFARLLQAAKIKPTDKILDVACNTGYSVSILSRLSDYVIGIEEKDIFISEALNNLKKLGITKVKINKTAIVDGYQKLQPYDVILIEGAITEIPENLLKQLSAEGRLLAISSLGHAFMMKKINQKNTSYENIFDCHAHIIPAFSKDDNFIFD